MKNFRKILILLLLAITFVSACKKDEKPLNENISPVGTLSLPLNQASIKLTPSNASASQQFKWGAATPEDGGLVLYEVAFDKEGGNFSAPVFKVVSDGGGVQPQVTI